MDKHLISWIRLAYGHAKIDARCKCLLPNHNIQVFMKGISKLNHVSSTEHDQICHFLLGVVIDICLLGNTSPPRLVHAVCGLLNFLYLAQYPCHLDETLNNCSTKYTECLHIDLAKDAYCTTNHKDEYVQMTAWLECR
ncbi:hypothetical protein PAXRUDRAFT_31734 [Paxillus rubicundulus Ve08.2h10]|uniref:Uncharacterized protein n=1 Tax=Paxillus rubicundulus Ve08.2h10 TaxID=930991 RepID=A0A0D0E1C6_9AGAM|nr:hypothetical protein PAXRUDRAFT_31734 [Paxillus rubicundulus Ve08.2h10]